MANETTQLLIDKSTCSEGGDRRTSRKDAVGIEARTAETLLQRALPEI
jgi:hypothetical protein